MSAPRLSILHLCGEGHPSGQTRVILDLARAERGRHRVTVGCPAGSVLEASVGSRGSPRRRSPSTATLPPGRPSPGVAAACGADVVNAHSSL
jgi:hypothetical protein